MSDETEAANNRLRFDLTYDLATLLIDEMGTADALRLPAGLVERMADVAISLMESQMARKGAKR